MLREAMVAIFTVALVALSSFSLDIARGLVAGNWEAAMIGFTASITGFIIALAVLISIGWWLVRDDRRRRKQESDRHVEINKLLIDISQELRELNQGKKIVR